MDVGEVPVLGAGSCCCCSCCGLGLAVGGSLELLLLLLRAYARYLVISRDQDRHLDASAADRFSFFPFSFHNGAFRRRAVVNRMFVAPVVAFVVCSLLWCCSSVDIKFKRGFS